MTRSFLIALLLFTAVASAAVAGTIEGKVRSIFLSRSKSHIIECCSDRNGECVHFYRYYASFSSALQERFGRYDLRS